MQTEIHSTGERHVAFVAEDRAASKVHGRERRGACGADCETRSAEVHEEGNAIGEVARDGARPRYSPVRA